MKTSGNNQWQCRHAHKARMITVFSLVTMLAACTSPETTDKSYREAPQWANTSDTHQQLKNLPPPKGRILTSTYDFRDQTGQYKPAPNSSFSTAVSQGAGPMLIKALKDSNWFVPVERTGLQNLLTERKIIRARDGDNQGSYLPPLVGSKIIIEGATIGYDTNIKTGGAGAKYFGISAFEKYRVDQVTVNLRAIDIQSGRIINSVTTSKTVMSRELNAGVFRYVKFKRLLEMETGYTRNEPAQLALQEAIETSVIRLIVTGIEQQHWELANPDHYRHPVMLAYGTASENIAESDIPGGVEEPSAKTKRLSRNVL